MSLNVVLEPINCSYPFTGAWLVRRTASWLSMALPYCELRRWPLFPTIAHRANLSGGAMSLELAITFSLRVPTGTDSDSFPNPAQNLSPGRRQANTSRAAGQTTKSAWRAGRKAQLNKKFLPRQSPD